ncbi:PHP domain-containing protein [Cellulosilyticum sp. I15G10I2]|uniref:PHP domain-containing protein n=1 Tax=Cellulosilyticum sp. I15G10I2 TaxID=1892843 RepID=UPI00085BD24A|nr:PHP domain-containing protein [Cellulosilyticum sp. I15G10I2]
MIDLHVHSTVSDGSNTPKEIIRMAYEKKIKLLALTDHDNIEGLEEAKMEASRYNIEFLDGIEVSASYKTGRLLHILGLGIDTKNASFLKTYTKFRKTREEKVENILRLINKQGISINIEELTEFAVGKYLDRQTIAKCLVKKGICMKVQEAWEKYLDPIAYEKGELLEVDETIDMIKKSGGLSFLAHYPKMIGLAGYTEYEKEEHIKYLVSLGLDGIECYYPSFSEEDTKYGEYLAKKYNLLCSGGSDFHGSNRPEVSLGSGGGDFCIPNRVYEEIKVRLLK